MNQKKIGLDLHGVIDSDPLFFSALTQALYQQEFEIHIITGGKFEEKEIEDLKKWGVVYTHVFSVYEWMLKNSTPVGGSILFPDGTVQVKFPDEEWDLVKANYCRENGIRLHIDDTLAYNQHFLTPFARYWSHSGKEKVSHEDIL